MWFGLIPHKEVDIMILSVGMSIRTSQTQSLWFTQFVRKNKQTLMKETSNHKSVIFTMKPQNTTLE